jgi:hypothetical protein
MKLFEKTCPPRSHIGALSLKCIEFLTSIMSYHKLKNIAISQENYLRLKKLGTAGDSFNDVVTELLQQVGGKE